ncbi:DUF3817 domain-containing protein [Moraxella boevrei]|uniref:DUF3817 domain-containing protein n=1 Tax=Faucicola boevrei TaxID=346665 RepID=UPI003735B102
MTPTHLRIISFLEGLSFILLGMAMYIRYTNYDYSYLVRYAGMTHGILFMAFMVILLIVCQRQKWSLVVFLLGLVASVIPFMPFVFERYIYKKEISENKL